MVKINKQIVSDNVIDKRSYGFGNPVNNITIHQTGNTNKGADAQAHANIQTNMNPRQASWHYSVDDKEVIQSFPDEVRCWHATDERGPGNMESVAIEICINSDGDYNKAIENAAELVKHLLGKHDLNLNDVKQHHDFYNKNCPAQLRGNYKGISWHDFLNMVDGEKVAEKPKQEAKSKKVYDYIRHGDKGAEVTKLQKRLIHLGYDLSKYGADGHFGDETEGAVRAFQKDEGIGVDGIVGPVTQKHLDKAEKSKSNKRYVTLPASAKTWRAYKLNVQPVKKNSTWKLTPSAFGGLTYEILDEPYPNVVTIETSRGKRNIYVAPGTGAKIK